MGYAVELVFDSDSEMQISELIRLPEANGIENGLIKFGTTPHITLTVSDLIDIDRVVEFVRTINIPKLKIQFCGIGTFAGSDNTIFLIPKVIKDLLNLQEMFHKHLSSYYKLWNNYYPERWIPHCTVAMGISDEVFNKTFMLLQSSMKPILAKVEKVRIIKFHPEEILYQREILY
ncbi:MAG: 2'-5' RNA ligase family protein [Bacteroidales bacterium]|jgi:2'-5' RNA ligase|nr:2'-5' RNA ligase family protein [Bacteroidales bacterium]